MINASKIVHHGGAGNQLSDFGLAASGPRDHLGDGPSQVRQSHSKEPSHRRRSQSCIDYSNKKAGTTTSGGDRKVHHSQEHNRQQANQ